jgi:hypothetical protein
MIYHPPHVVHDAYVRTFGLRDPTRLYTRMAPNVWVMERRLINDEMLLLGDFTATIETVPGKVHSIDIRALYKPVFLGNDLGNGVFDYLEEPHPASNGVPYSWWLRPELVAASERIRYPALPTKMNLKEGIDAGDLRELYSWEGLAFKLRDEGWGRD